MANNSEHQMLLFQLIRDKLLPHMSLADEISDLLNISTDSAYRRIRNEKKLELDEFYLLSRHYGISADTVFKTDHNLIRFNFLNINEKSFDFEKFLETILYDLKLLVKQNNPRVYCIFNELHIFQLLLIPKIAAFKMFFWSKSNFMFEAYREMQFSVSHLNPRILKLSGEIIQIYNRIPSIEFFTFELISSMLKQLDFYFEAGYFKSIEDAREICDALSELICHLKMQAELGFKFAYSSDPKGTPGNFELYFNDLLIVDNTVLAGSDQSKKTYITTNVVNLLVSDSMIYYEQNEKWAKNLIGKSVLISGASERARNKIFRSISDQIDNFRAKLDIKEKDHSF